MPIQTPASWSNIRRADDPGWRVSSHLFGTALANYIQLDIIESRGKVQRGDQPDDFKPMPAIGKGVEEIHVWDSSGAYRVVYLARRAEAVYVLHAFHKKAQATPKKDFEIAKGRFRQLLGGRI